MPYQRAAIRTANDRVVRLHEQLLGLPYRQSASVASTLHSHARGWLAQGQVVALADDVPKRFRDKK